MKSRETEALDTWQHDAVTDTPAQLQYLRQLDSVEVVQRLLLQLIEAPEKNDPFNFYLRGIEAIIQAESSAIFTTFEPFWKFDLLTRTNAPDQAWHKRCVSEILPKIFPFGRTGEKITLFNVPGKSYSLLFIKLHDEQEGCSILALKFRSGLTVSTAVRSRLLVYSGRLAAIVSSVCIARKKMRHAQYEERVVIARELHDSLAQSLSYLKIQTSRLQSRLASKELKRYSKSMEMDAMMQDLRSNIDVAYRHLRELISTFRLTMGGKNFSQALTDSVEEFTSRSALAFDVDNRLPVGILTVTEETQLLHIIREALSNVVRHAHAKYISISIHYSEHGEVSASIEDDGIGFPDISNSENHFGIIMMQERAASINGKFYLSDRLNGGGACLKIIFPAEKIAAKMF